MAAIAHGDMYSSLPACACSCKQVIQGHHIQLLLVFKPYRHAEMHLHSYSCCSWQTGKQALRLQHYIFHCLVSSVRSHPVRVCIQGIKHSQRSAIVSLPVLLAAICVHPYPLWNEWDYILAIEAHGLAHQGDDMQGPAVSRGVACMASVGDVHIAIVHGSSWGRSMG